MNIQSFTIEPSSIGHNTTVIRRAKDTAASEYQIEKKKVAVYCRVSTDYETQESSLELQMSAYLKTIEEHPDWELAGIFADEGISGTQADKRPEFQRMIHQAELGNIDIIMVKSISRFSRNTKDTLEYTRWLKEKGISVYFEKEGIDTAGISSEIILTILAAFAQEESRSISENIKRGLRNKFCMGEAPWYTIYGYRKGYVIEEKEAEIVRMLFQLAAQEKSTYEIAEYMNKKGIPAQGGKAWLPSTIGRTLKNEKYKGDVMLQKTYVDNYMTHKIVKNNDGVVEKYYVKKHHPAIVEEELFDRVQILLALNSTRSFRQSPFYGVLLCPICGKPMVKIGQFGNLDYGFWVCGGEGPAERIGDRTNCPTYMLFDNVLRRTIAKVLAGLNPFEEKNIPLSKAILTAQSHATDLTYLDITYLMEFITTKDYDKIVIKWKLGWTEEYRLLYLDQYDVMYPVLQKNQKGTCKIFGMRTIRLNQFLETFKKRQLKILDYRVIDPLPGDPSVPRIEKPFKKE